MYPKRKCKCGEGEHECRLLDPRENGRRGRAAREGRDYKHEVWKRDVEPGKGEAGPTVKVPVETLVVSATTGVIPKIKKTVVADSAGYGVEVVKGDVCMECTEIGRHALLCSQRPRVAPIEGRKVAKAGRAESGEAKGLCTRHRIPQKGCWSCGV